MIYKKNPLPNEHAARQKSPKDFKTFRRSKSLRNKSLPSGVSVIYGIRKEKGPRGGLTDIQSFRFDKNKWNITEAKKWLRQNKFETKIEKAVKRNPEIRKHIDDKLYDILSYAIIYGDANDFSNAITYFKSGENCTDCKRSYVYCGCEGSTIYPGEECEDCGANRCLCNYDINVGSDAITVRQKIYTFIKNNLTSTQERKLVNIIIDEVPYVNIYKIAKKKKLSLLEIIGLLNEKR